MKTIDAKQCTAIALGRLGENDYTVVRFDVSAWLEEVSGAVIGLYNQRPGDAAAYPVAGITVDGGIAAWTVTSAELTQTGQGKCELVAIAGEVVAKSAIFRTIVFDALDGSGEAPEPWEEWQQQLIILKNEAEQAADRAEEAVGHYPRINNGVWEAWDAQAGAFVSTGVQAQGPQGIQGVPGPQGEPGAHGETGPQGEPGADGVTFTPSVSAEGVISWTNDGGKPNPQSQSIKGPVGATPNLTIGTVETLEPGADATAEITGTPENPVLNLGIPQGDKGEDADISNLAPIIVNSASGDIASFADGAEDMPVKALIVNVEPVQDLHGYDSPWPAGGGVNLFDIDNITSVSGAYGLTTSIDGDVVRISGTYTGSGTSSYRIIYHNQTLIEDARFAVFRLDTNSIRVSLRYASTSDNAIVAELKDVTPNTDIDVRFRFVMYTGTTIPTAYSPYSNICPITGWTGATISHSGADTTDPDEIIITFPTSAGTVYGGTLDVTNGVLTVDRAMVDLGTLEWTYNTTYAFFASNSLANRAIGVTNVKSDLFKTKPGSWSGTPLKNAIWGNGSNATIYVQIPPYDNVADFVQLVAGHQLVYYLATPITYTITPQEIRTLLGTNNIWADAGPVDAEYRADTKLYIDKKFAELQALILEH